MNTPLTTETFDVRCPSCPSEQSIITLNSCPENPMYHCIYCGKTFLTDQDPGKVEDLKTDLQEAEGLLEEAHEVLESLINWADLLERDGQEAPLPAIFNEIYNVASDLRSRI